MKMNRMKTLCLISGALACALNLIAQDTNIDWGTASDDQVILQAIELTSPIPPSQIPANGLFYSAQHSPISAQPWPPFPANVDNLSGWDIGSDVWVLDDIDFSYDAAAAQTSQSMMAMDADSPALPGTNDDGGTNTFSPDGVGFDPGTNLWLAQQSVSGGNFTGILSNTVSGVSYQLLYANSLNPPIQWISDGFVTGTDGTNWTPWTLPFDPTTNFFLNALSWQTDGSGIPIWWQEEYFGTNSIDPYADPVGDGYTLYQDYINGWIPTNWNTPPAPQGLAIDSFSSRTASLSWLPSPGPITGYTMQTSHGNVNVGNVTSYSDDDSSMGTTYAVEADYAGGPSAWSASVTVGDPAPNAAIVPGPQGNLYLVASGLPSDLSAIQISRNSWNSGGPINNEFPFSDEYIDQGNFPNDPLRNGNFQIPAADITNGICEIPSSEVTPFFPYTFEIETIRSNGVTSAETESGGNVSLAQVPFIDGRADFKDNLRFLFRAANDPYPYLYDATGPFQFENFTWPSDHICVDFYSDGVTNDEEDPEIASYPDALEPLEDNIFYKNFVWNADNVTNIVTPGTTGWAVIPNTGITYLNPQDLAFNYGDISDPGVEYYFNANAFMSNPIVPVSAISLANSTYLTASSFYAAINFYQNFPYGGAMNVYGLPFVAAEGAWYTNKTFYNETYYPGNPNMYGWPYPDAQEPDFQITNYYFCIPGIDPMPEDEGFALTNTPPPIIVSVGTEVQLAGYAQMAVTNGYPCVYGYLGQYFTNAYQMDDNGNVTTNTTGLLSPYGQFFATQGGAAALVTMPDPDTGQQGTGVVYCLSLNVDANHDGVMDTSFSGPDTTSENSPMEFWVNNGCDEPSAIGGYDAMVPPGTNNYTLGEITCPRDLENFTRLWICGMPSLPTNGNYQVTLSWENVQSGSPAVNLYWSCESDGGIGYLTNASVAALQISDLPGTPYGTSIGTVSNGSSYTFPDNTFEFGGNQYLLFEGAGIGEGELTLTVSQNGNPIAQSGVWLDLHNIQDFFEQAVITNNESGSISNWTSQIDSVTEASANALGNDTNNIVFVHGFDVGYWDWLDDSDTVFKRLYWAGFDGQFMTVKWPDEPLTTWNALSKNASVFNDSEIDAYKASTALASYLTQLRSRYPGYRLNVLAHSQGNAIMGEAIEHGAPFDNYILTQGAMPDSSYDVNAPTNSTLDDAEASHPTPLVQPMGYEGIYTNMVGNIINFYNTNDPVLAYWDFDQKYGKPNGYAIHSFQVFFGLPLVSSYYSFDGTNSWYNTPSGDGTYLVTDPEESRAMVSRSLTLSIGQSPPESAHGVISSGIDLKAAFGFNNVFPIDHSAQWAWPIQTTFPYYQQVLTSFQIEPIP